MQRFFTLVVSMSIGGLLAAGHPAEVRAQTVFCPATFTPSNGPVALANGSCTDGQNGALVPRWLVRRSANYLRRQPKRLRRKLANLLPSGVTKSGSAAQRDFRGWTVPVGGFPSPSRSVQFGVPSPSRRAQFRRKGRRQLRLKQHPGNRATGSAAPDRTCRPVWDLDPGLWRLPEEGRCGACHPELLHGSQSSHGRTVERPWAAPARA